MGRKKIQWDTLLWRRPLVPVEARAKKISSIDKGKEQIGAAPGHRDRPSMRGVERAVAGPKTRSTDPCYQNIDQDGYLSCVQWPFPYDQDWRGL